MESPGYSAVIVGNLLVETGNTLDFVEVIIPIKSNNRDIHDGQGMYPGSA